MTDEQNRRAIEDIRRWLKDGATIRAVDPSKNILVDLGDGRIFGGLQVEFPPSLCEAIFENCTAYSNVPEK